MRSATADDEPFVRELSREVFSRFGDYETILSEYFHTDGVRTVVAESGGSPAGFVMYDFPSLRPVVVELIAIAVRPASQRRGTGRALLEHVHRAASLQAEPGTTAYVCLTVAEDNDRAKAFFAEAGYVREPETSGLYPGGQRSIGMVRPVRDA